MHSPLSLTIGTHIKTYRLKKGLKQKELSSALAVSAQFLGKLEKGLVPIPESVLAKSIAALDLKPKLIKKAYLDEAELKCSYIFEKAKLNKKT